MITKAKLIEEKTKSDRKVFIWENIGIGMSSTIQEKERAAKEFLQANDSFTPYEVCTTIHLSRGTFYNYLNHKVDKPWFIEKEEMLVKEIKRVFDASRQLYGTVKIAFVLKKKGS